MDPAQLIEEVLDGLQDNSTPQIWQPEPQNKPQCLAYRMAVSGRVMEIGYGGRAGGGKTDLALGLAGTHFKRALIMRREFPQLEGIIDRGNELFDAPFVYGIRKRWTLAEGRTITLGSMQYAGDWRKQQGKERDLIAIDEAAECPENAVRMVTGWARSKPGKHTLVLYLFNPPTTPEGEWIVNYFAPWIKPDYEGVRAKAGEVRWFVSIPEGKRDKSLEVPNGDPYLATDGRIYYPISRTFIPASRKDNPYLDEEYERRLDALPEPMRSIIRDGDFTLGHRDDEWQVIPTQWVLLAQERGRRTPKPAVNLRAIGVDVAHGGEDKTTIARLYGTWFDQIIEVPGSATPLGQDVARLVIKHMTHNATIGIDAVGYGSSAAEFLEGQLRKRVLKINAGAGSTKTRRADGTEQEATDKSGTYGFFNYRAEMYWRLREALDPESGEEICLPDDRELRVQLCAARYRLQRGRYLIEDKDNIRKRLKRSPDKAEAVLHAWATTTKSRLITSLLPETIIRGE